MAILAPFIQRILGSFKSCGSLGTCPEFRTFSMVHPGGFVTSLIWIILAAVVTTTTSGCSYKLGFKGRAVPGGYHQVAVPVFKNKTGEAGIEVYFTDAFIRELERSKLAHVVSKDDAEVTVEGVIQALSYLQGPQQSASPGDPVIKLPAGTLLTTQYRIVMGVTIRVRRNSDQKIVWASSFSGERPYLAPNIEMPVLNSADPIYNHSAHYQNIEMLARSMMAEANERLTDNF